MKRLTQLVHLGTLVSGLNSGTLRGRVGSGCSGVVACETLGTWRSLTSGLSAAAYLPSHRCFNSSSTSTGTAAIAAPCQHSSDLCPATPHPLEGGDLLPLIAPITAAASPLEDSLALVLSPTQLGVQFWEAVHTASGLPWWATIPAGTLALRAALLPLSLRAFSASSNIALLNRAFGRSRDVGEAVAAAAAAAPTSRGTAAAQPSGDSDSTSTLTVSRVGFHVVSCTDGITGGGAGAAAGASGDDVDGGAAGAGAAAAAGASGGSSGMGDDGAGSLGRMELVRRVASYLRSREGAPSFKWYLVNTAVQVPLLVSLTLALRRMSDSLWPGLTTEGGLYFPDLTAPPMYLGTLSTPYGTAGTILPLALVLLYISITDRSAGGSSPGINMALKLLLLPLYVAALQQPHAVLLFWLTHAVTQLGVYEVATRVPYMSRSVGVPRLLLPPEAPRRADQGQDGRTIEAEQSQEEPGQEQDAPLDDLLLALADSYEKAGNRSAARSCLQALLTRNPGHRIAGQRLRELMG